MNEQAGFEHVEEPTEQDRARLAAEAERDLQERQEAEW